MDIVRRAGGLKTVPCSGKKGRAKNVVYCQFVIDKSLIKCYTEKNMYIDRGSIVLAEQPLVMFMEKVLFYLEKYLKAPEKTFLFTEGDLLSHQQKEYFCRVIYVYDNSPAAYMVGFRNSNQSRYKGRRFLLDVALREICALFNDTTRFRQRIGIQNPEHNQWFYDDTCHKWHDPQSLARAVYEAICQDTIERIYAFTGVNPRDISCVADMAYEKDEAKGCIVFRTTEDGESAPSVHVCADRETAFSEESQRFIRKQLAGAGNGGLLFSSNSTELNRKYFYRGYLQEPAAGDAYIMARLEGRGSWSLHIGGQPLLRVKFHDLFVPDDPLDPVRIDIDREFGPGMADKLGLVLEALREQSRGTSIILLNTEDPASRKMLDRLEGAGRALRVEPIHILDHTADEKQRDSFVNLLRNISRIDGALILDYQKECICYVNVIVDGLALLKNGTFRAFGARHNALSTAITTLVSQVQTGEAKAMAVIFSEDGEISRVCATDCRNEWKAQTGGGVGTAFPDECFPQN